MKDSGSRLARNIDIRGVLVRLCPWTAMKCGALLGRVCHMLQFSRTESESTTDNKGATKMTPKNEQITSFLHEYFTMGYAPGYAVMVKGKWGAGKTWHVKDVAAQRIQDETGRGPIYVSLYGITTASGIDDEIFRQLHPILASDGMRVVTRVAKGLMKGVLKIDLDGDGKDDASINPAMPELDKADIFKKSSSRGLIFDDLERCEMTPKELLGYINFFVEHSGNKVVIIGNEKELEHRLQTDGDKSEFASMRDKLVGKSFEIEADSKGAIIFFVNELKSEPAATFLKSRIDLLCEVHDATGKQNLRDARQAILELERLLSHVDAEFLKNEDAARDLMTSFIILFLEYRSRNLAINDIVSVSTRSMVASMKGNASDDKTDIFLDLNARYMSYRWTEGPISADILAQILDTGHMDADVINASIAKSKYFSTSEEPDWRRLASYFRLEDAAFEGLLATVLRRFKDNEYKVIGVMRHVVGILMSLAQEGLCPMPSDEILKQAKANVVGLKDAGKLELSDEHFGELDGFGWGGLVFASRDVPQFDELTQFIRNTWEETKAASLPGKAETLLKALQEGDIQAARSLYLTSSPGGGMFHDTPILANIEPKKFVEAMLNASPSAVIAAMTAIGERYKHLNVSPNVKKEKGWLVVTAALLSDEATRNAGRVSGLRIKNLASRMEEAVSVFETS
ncbi:P-loop NTPase fold protein [Humidesulfovibrio sp.]|uniref:P-loop NTPase fold protein n=1 Tax=Humidesulfovibrio sp. TaxID=2910988 RepID=UPI00280AA838|nr:P-loop NTPase fold protein [Humidesulfovibrio sp.]